MSHVPLARKFSLVPEPYQREDIGFDEIWAGLQHGERLGWDTLVQQYRVVILADAGAGKTHELRSSAERIIAEGKPAFFIRIEDIDEDFAAAFEIGSEDVFNSWLNGTGEAWFFLDSVDEIRLSEQRAFETAINAFATRILDARQRAHIYISSRPYAWRTALDRTLIERVLPFERRLLEATGGDDEVGGETNSAQSAEDSNGGPDGAALKLYMLAALDDLDIRQFAYHQGVSDVDAFLTSLERGALLPIARLPFDLQDLIAAWLEKGTLGARLAVLQSGICRQLTQDPSILGLPSLSLERSLDAVRLLAMAVVLTGISSIRLPGSRAREAIDAEALLQRWSAAEVGALLTTGVFGDPIYGEVRFRHREVRELLAAEWAASLIDRVGGRAQLDLLIFRSQYGQEVLPPRLRPLLPWLILFDAETRDRVLALNPEIAAEGGDASQLPLEVRQTLLTKLIEQVVTPTSPLRGLDNSAIARIAQRDLEGQVLALLKQHHDNDDAIFVLGRLVWQGEMAGCVDTLSAIAADPLRGIYSRIVSVRAVATVGSPKQLHCLWRQLNAGLLPLPRRLLAELADQSPANENLPALLLDSIQLLEQRQEFEGTGLTGAVCSFVGRFPKNSSEANEAPLVALAVGFREFLSLQPHIERGECRISKEFQWLMKPALLVAERLIAVKSPAALSDPILAILAAAPELRYWRSHNDDDLKSTLGPLVQGWDELNDALFWWTVSECRQSKPPRGGVVVDDWPITWLGHFWAFDTASFSRTLAWIRERKLGDDRLVALARAFRTYAENDRPADWASQLREAVEGDPILTSALEAKLNPPVSQDALDYQQREKQRRRKRNIRDRKHAVSRAGFVSDVIANPDDVRSPPGLKPGEISGAQYHLLRIIEGEGLRSTRAQGADWERLVPEFGIEVATAYRDAALAHWRAFKPGLRSEGANTNSIPYALVFAMAGLDIELGDIPTPTLERGEVRRALRYATWELNGFPRWLEALYRAWPKIGRDFIWKEVEWELSNSRFDQPSHYILSDIVYYGSWLHAEIGPLIYSWLKSEHPPNDDCLRNCRTIIMGSGILPADLATLARLKVADPSTPLGQLPTWFAMWADYEPATAIVALNNLLTAGAPTEPTSFALEFLVGLLGGRRENSPVFGSFRTPTFLKELYLLMHRTIPVAEDIDRVGKGVYSPTLRDDAQDARERLLGLLHEIPGELTYRAILELAEIHPEPRFRDYMRTRAARHAVNDDDVHPWTLSQLAEQARRLSALPRVGATEAGDAKD
ncbi:MAG: hypothetical protein EON59_03620 [Alphaproteobacteria bacterium]|nr:MAG: hypothetical protein EON59_03620 [Alphaproteobacteria bacterium]